LNAVFIFMGRDDLAVKTIGCFQVVVEAVHAGFGQAFGFFGGQDSQGSADLHTDLGLDTAGGFADDIQVAVAGTVGGGDHAVFPCASGFGFAGALHERFDFHHGIFSRGCRVFGGLGAEAAVFGASARLRVLQNVNTDLVAVKVTADFVSGVDDGKGLFFGSKEDHLRFLTGRGDLLKGLLGQDVPQVGGSGWG